MAEPTNQHVAPRFIALGTVLAGPERFDFNGNVNAVYRGRVLRDDGEIVSAFIKDLDARQLGNELLAAAIGLAVGLPVPPPMVALAAPDTMPASHIPLEDGSGHLVFATADVHAPPVLQLLRDAGFYAPQIIKRLSEWPELGSLYGFDSWVANTDRHRGNLLFSGDKDVWLIDHGHCFTGPAWTTSGLVPDQDYGNRLAAWLTPALNPSRKTELATPASTLPSRLNGLRVEALARANSVSETMPPEEFSAIVTFLEQRAAFVPKLSTEALGLLL